MHYLNAVGNLAGTNRCVPSYRRGNMPDTGKLAEGQSSASDATTSSRSKEEKATLPATTDSNRLADSRHAGLLLHTVPMLLVIFLATCLAVANVLYFPVSPDAAFAAPGKALTSKSATASNSPDHAHARKWHR